MLVVFGMFFVYSAVQSPVPGVNEPQYLGKAKHLWDPDWAAGDFFLESSNPHLVFYLALGWLTRFLTLDATAWVARVAGYAVVAAGWTMLAERLLRSRWAAVFAAAIFLLLASIGNLSGEWLVGGIEGKVIAYGLLFAAVALWLGGRTIASAACLGGAISFHPVVGVWGMLCGATAEAFELRHGDRSAVGNRRDWAVTAIVFVATALPGLVPAVLLLDGSAPDDAARATYIQVFIRLRHHLDPTQFSTSRYVGYGLLLVGGLTLWIGQRRWPHESGSTAGHATRWFLVFVLMSVAIAIAGIAIGWHSGSAWTMPLRDLRGTLLKFYPFRLADVLVPLAFSMATAAFLTHRRTKPRVALIAGITLFSFAGSLLIASPDRNPSRMSPRQLAAWIDAARWVRTNTPQGSVIVTPFRQWAFRWYAHRAEYVNYKDAPQDTAGLLEWERRQNVLIHWWESSPDGRYRADDLRRLGERTDAGYLVTSASPLRFTVDAAYANEFYRVYALP